MAKLPAKVRSLTRSVNQELAQRGIRHATYLERLKTGEANKVAKLLTNDVMPDIINELEGRLRNIATRGYDTSAQTTQRLRDMTKAIYGQIQGGMRYVSDKVHESMSELAISESKFWKTLITDTVPFDISMVEPSPVLLRSIVTSRPFEGRLLKDWYSDLSTATQRRLTQQLNIGLVQGESVPQLMNRIRGNGGLGDMTRRDATAIVRTATNHVSSQAREITYEENDDVVSSVQFHATLDGRTTPQCKALDGKIFEIGKGPRPPIHFNCRSTTVPVLKSWEELGIKGLKDIDEGSRASMDGQVPGTMTYNDWLKTQPEAFQNETLGPARAKLFREGMSVDKFVDDKLKPLTLKELEKLELTADHRALIAPPTVKPVRIVDDEPVTVMPALTIKDPLADKFAPDAEPRKGNVQHQFDNPEDFKRMKSEYKKLTPELTRTEEDALDEYRDYAYRDINKSLRALDWNELPKDGTVERTLFDAINKAPAVADDTIVHRVLGYDPEHEVGSEFLAKGIVSTSRLPVSKFVNESKAGYEIFVKKGSSKVLAGFNDVELEYLMNHGSRFRVINKSTIKYDLGGGGMKEQVVYRLEYLGVG